MLPLILLVLRSAAIKIKQTKSKNLPRPGAAADRHRVVLHEHQPWGLHWICQVRSYLFSIYIWGPGTVHHLQNQSAHEPLKARIHFHLTCFFLSSAQQRINQMSKKKAAGNQVLSPTSCPLRCLFDLLLYILNITAHEPRLNSSTAFHLLASNMTSEPHAPCSPRGFVLLALGSVYC